MENPSRITDEIYNVHRQTEFSVTFPDIIEHEQWTLKQLKERFPVSDEQSENKI